MEVLRPMGPAKLISIASTVSLDTAFASIDAFYVEAQGGPANWTADGSDPGGTIRGTLPLETGRVFYRGEGCILKFKGTNLFVQPLRP